MKNLLGITVDYVADEMWIGKIQPHYKITMDENVQALLEAYILRDYGVKTWDWDFVAKSDMVRKLDLLFGLLRTQFMKQGERKAQRAIWKVNQGLKIKEFLKSFF